MSAPKGKSPPPKVVDLPTTLEGAIALASKVKCSMGGENGVFIGAKVYDHLLAMVNDSNPNDVRVKELEQILETRVDQAKLVASLKENLSNARDAFKEQQTSFKEHEQELRNTLEFRDNVIAECEQRIKWFEQEKVKLAKENKTATWENDTLEIEQLQKEIALNKEALANARSECKAATKARNVAQDDISKFSVERKGLKDKIESMQKELDSVNAIKHNIDMQELSIRDIDSNLEKVRKVIGARAMNWFLETELANRENLRDQTFKTLMMIKNSSNVKVSSLLSLFEIVFEWIKHQTRAKRELVRPWIEGIVTDIKTNSVKSFSYYRVKLEEIIQSVKIEFHNIKADYQKFKYEGLPKRVRMTFLSSIDRLRKRMLSVIPSINNIKSFFSRIGKKISEFFGFRKFRKHKPVTWEDVRQIDLIDEQDFDNEKLNEKGKGTISPDSHGAPEGKGPRKNSNGGSRFPKK